MEVILKFTLALTPLSDWSPSPEITTHQSRLIVSSVFLPESE